MRTTRQALLIAVAMLQFIASEASAARSHAVRGYTKKDGTHVAPSHATNPNKSKKDNYSSKGNVNPYTGKEGTKKP